MLDNNLIRGGVKMSKKRGFIIIFLLMLSLFFLVAQAGASDVYFCLEANCSSVTVTFGGQTHSSTLNCSNILGYTGVPAGTYSFSASGCGLIWSGSVSVDGTSNYGFSLCPASGGQCCSQGCEEKYGTGRGFACDECSTGPCPLKAAFANDPDILELLKSFRNDLLRHSLTGVALIKLYYDNSAELKRIMVEDPVLGAWAKEFVLGLVPLVEQCLAGHSVYADQAILSEADELLAAFQARGNLQLRNDLEKLRQELATGELIQEICQ
jgi:hypothetical protein